MEGVYVIGLHVAHRLKRARWITLTEGSKSPVDVKINSLKKSHSGTGILCCLYYNFHKTQL